MEQRSGSFRFDPEKEYRVFHMEAGVLRDIRGKIISILPDGSVAVCQTVSGREIVVKGWTKIEEVLGGDGTGNGRR